MPDLDNISLMSGDSDRNSTKGITLNWLSINNPVSLGQVQVLPMKSSSKKIQENQLK